MSSEGPQSPRAAIKDWLFRNDQKLGASRPRLALADNAGKEKMPRERHRARPHADVEEVPSQLRQNRSRQHQDNHEGTFQKCPGRSPCPLEEVAL